MAGILLSTFVFLLLAPFLAQSLGIAAEQVLCYADRRKAMSRIAAFEHFLKAPAFYCGLGMPLDPGAYNDAFHNGTAWPFNWKGPIATARYSISFAVDSALQIAYAQPGSTYLENDAVVGGGNMYITMQKAPTASEVTTAAQYDYAVTQSWIIFPGGVPQKKWLRVRSKSGAKLGVDIPAGGSVSLQKNDRMCLYRALFIYTNNDILYTQDYRSSGAQPRIYGIRDLRFEVDLEKRQLTAYVLARGDRQYDKARPVAGRESLPEKYRAEWDKKAGQYQLIAQKIVWGLPNCTKTTLLGQNGVAERF